MRSGAHVLIVDDEWLVAIVLEDYLLSRGYRTSLARNGAQALEMFLRDPPDAVVTDIRMPVMDGLELTRRIRELDPNQPVVMVSGHGRSDEALVTEDARTACLPKPVDLDDLHARLVAFRRDRQLA